MAALTRTTTNTRPQVDASEPPASSQAEKGIGVNLDGFQADAALIGDGRVNINLRKPGRVCATVDKLLRSMALHDDAEDATDLHAPRLPPCLNIVLQIVGSRGDIQPFIALGLELQKFGHRVRIATHAPFRTYIEDAGLEFFSIGGDPKGMMAYMVNNPGLLPNLKSIHAGDVERNREGVREILEGCWLSCFTAGNNLDDNLEDKGKPAGKAKPFVANAIIANPPSFAHIHCAEKLGIPLHMMFTMPWSPTKAFPHPLANIESCSVDPRSANYFSFILTETMMWLGLGDLINSFRTDTLGLMPLDILSAPTAIPKLQIPFTYCWSPSLIPKPVDWGPSISISGNYSLPRASTYTPPHHLKEFLDDGSPPIYIGFGSIVLDDPDHVTQLLLEAIQDAGVRAVITRGWADLGRNVVELPPDVLFIENCPHDWIFERVSCTIHHGGAGTTAAAVAAGKPSVIVPFFGDQSFWGRMVAIAGAGPRPIPFKNLSASSLASAIRTALDPEVRQKASDLGRQVAEENGVANGVQEFHSQLSKYALNCSILQSRAAAWKVRGTDIKLSTRVAAVLMEEGLFDLLFIEPLRMREYDLNFGAIDPISGGIGVALGSAVQLLKGVKQIGASFSSAFKGASSHPSVTKRLGSSISDGLGGAWRASRAVIRVPIDTGVAITQGVHNSPRLWGGQVRRKHTWITDFGSGLKAGGNELVFGVYDGITGIFMEPYSHGRRNKMTGVISGLGIGALSFIANLTSGTTGIISYPLKGIDAQIVNLINSKRMNPVELALVTQGQSEFMDTSMQERAAIVHSWEAFMGQVSTVGKRE